MIKLPPCWATILGDEFSQTYWADLQRFVAEERAAHLVFPPPQDVFAALAYPVQQTKVIILGQDPYHDVDQAHGLAFSVPSTVAIPPSLRNIFRALKLEFGFEPPTSGDLSPWSKQGVMLLNTVLTVRAHSAHSHRGQGWERFTDAIISALSKHRENLVFVFWGAAAAKKQTLVDPAKHLVLKAPHPSPLSAYRGFYDCGHFSAINAHLELKGSKPIDWCLTG
jgi:uracil-DNA glycosylase